MIVEVPMTLGDKRSNVVDRKKYVPFNFKQPSRPFGFGFIRFIPLVFAFHSHLFHIDTTLNPIY